MPVKRCQLSGFINTYLGLTYLVSCKEGKAIVKSNIMPTLTEDLESISAWVQKRFPDSQALQPGLSYETIQKEASNLPFELPTEINGLYL